MTKVTSKHRFIKSINIAVLVPMLLVSLLTIVLYVVSGIDDAYETKLQQVDELSSVLAISSSSATASVEASAQLAHISYQDLIIKSAKFYTFERIEDLSSPETLNLIEILTHETVSVQEPVASSVIAHRATGRKKTQTMMGYINITIDLTQLRIDWLQEHIYKIIGIAVIYSILTWMILAGIKRPLRQLNRMSSSALSIINDDIDDVHVLLSHDFNYVELNQIKALICELNNRYKVEHNAYQELKRYGRRNNLNQNSSLQESSFQSMVTHELKTSLDKISSGLQLLEHYYMSDEQKAVVDTINMGSTQLESILSQIIQLSRIEKGHMSVQIEEFQPIQLINELVDKYKQHAESRGIKMSSTINHIDCILRGDEPKIRSILESLISNALKFTEKGSIKIESNLIYFEGSIRWWINVIDTGIGIEDKYLKDVFLPFQNINPKPKYEFNDIGINLGLANRLAQLLDGHILVESELNKGSKFSLVLSLPNNQYSYEHQRLSGVKVVCFTSRDITTAMRQLKSLDIQAVKFSDKQKILEHIDQNPVNMLIIASDIAFDLAVSLTQQVRENEVSSRVLIIYYRYKFTHSQINTLQMAGVDLCRSVPKAEDIKDEAIVYRNWLGLG